MVLISDLTKWCLSFNWITYVSEKPYRKVLLHTTLCAIAIALDWNDRFSEIRLYGGSSSALLDVYYLISLEQHHKDITVSLGNITLGAPNFLDVERDISRFI